MSGRGYTVGPILEPGEEPFASGWEQNPNLDKCVHVWESVLLPPTEWGRKGTECVRCLQCHCPRCGDALGDPDPCMKRRHHSDEHRYLSGATRKVGA